MVEMIQARELVSVADLLIGTGADILLLIDGIVLRMEHMIHIRMILVVRMIVVDVVIDEVVEYLVEHLVVSAMTIGSGLLSQLLETLQYRGVADRNQLDMITNSKISRISSVSLAVFSLVS